MNKSIYRLISHRIAKKYKHTMRYYHSCRSLSSSNKIPLPIRHLNHSLLQRRFYNNNNGLSSLLERLRNGEITKAEVQRLILNQEHLSNRVSDLQQHNRTITSMNDNSISNSGGGSNRQSLSSLSYHQQKLNNSKITELGDVSGTGALSTIQSIGSKGNPLWMKRQTTMKEFIFSLFPFVFIFWMLGGFEMVKSRNKAGGVAGGMFGNNYSEWDEEDWEDDDDEMDDNNKDEENNVIQQDNAEKQNENKTAENEDDRSAFFRRLGINLNNKKDNENDDKKDGNLDKQNNMNVNVKKKRKKLKRVRFKNVCGNEEAKLDLQDLVDYLRNPEKYQKMGCKLPKGVLMAGAPGTGKTLLARAVAGEAGVPFLATNGASFDEIFVGVGVMRVRKLFERAREKAPCIVFIDEIDAIANTRMQMGTAHSSDSLNALLSEMDGFEQNSGVIVIAATNMPDRLDAALVRPGRFDRKVHLQLPDRKAREAIVRLYLGDRGSDNVDLELLVSDISGFSGAELESMVNLASIECVKQNHNEVTMEHLIEAKEVISMGRARRSMDVSLRTKQITAHHEGGHAIVSLYTLGSKPIYKATILPRGTALGFVASSNEDEFMSTKQSLLAQLDVCMGGRAAEEVFSGHKQITTGASSDFNQATRIATLMVCQWGMSEKVGKVYYQIEDVSKLSPDIQNLINSEVKRLLDESYYRSMRLIKKHEYEWKLLATTLLDKETLNGDEIRELIKYDETQKSEPNDHCLSDDSNNKNPNNKQPLNLQKKIKETFQKNVNNPLAIKPETELLNPHLNST